MTGQDLINKRKDKQMNVYKSVSKSEIMRDELWDYLLETNTATEEEMSLVTSINGWSLDSLESILYSRTGYRSLAQIKELEEDY